MSGRLSLLIMNDSKIRLINFRKSLIVLFLFLLFCPTLSLGQTSSGDGWRRLIRSEETLPYVSELAKIICNSGRTANLDYMSIIYRDSYATFMKMVDVAEKTWSLPSYNAITAKEKDFLAQTRVSLVLKRMRSMCPDVW